jgi:GNAT superfamily N-acetyltransferase
MIAPVFRRYAVSDRDAVLAICIAAFEPIHDGFRVELGADLFDLWYSDWRLEYAKTLDNHDVENAANRLHVMIIEGEIVGFVFAAVDAKGRGEIGLNAVAPVWQGKGLGHALYEHALADLKQRGALAVCVGTGGDAAHAAARSAYRRTGFERAIPSVYLFRKL